MTSAEIRTFPHSAPQPDGQEPLDLVFIEGFEGQTVIGIHSSELHDPQPLVIDIVAGAPRLPAAMSDQIGDTIDYSVVLQRLRELMVSHRVKLLEALAEIIARMLLDDFGAHWVQVRVAKPRKFPDTQAVGVTIERRRTPAALPNTPANVLSLLGRGLIPPSR